MDGTETDIGSATSAGAGGGGCVGGGGASARGHTAGGPSAGGGQAGGYLGGGGAAGAAGGLGLVGGSALEAPLLGKTDPWWSAAWREARGTLALFGTRQMACLAPFFFYTGFNQPYQLNT